MKNFKELDWLVTNKVTKIERIMNILTEDTEKYYLKFNGRKNISESIIRWLVTNHMIEVNLLGSSLVKITEDGMRWHKKELEIITAEIHKNSEIELYKKLHEKYKGHV